MPEQAASGDKKALMIAAGRNALSILRSEKQQAPSWEWFGPDAVVESYSDESRSEDGRFAVGSLLLAYPYAEVRSALERALADRGLTSGVSELSTVPPQHHTRHIPKQPANYEPWLIQINKVFEELKIGVAACGLTASKIPSSQLNCFLTALSEADLDLQFRSMLMDSLEATLFDVV